MEFTLTNERLKVVEPGFFLKSEKTCPIFWKNPYRTAKWTSYFEVFSVGFWQSLVIVIFGAFMYLIVVTSMTTDSKLSFNSLRLATYLSTVFRAFVALGVCGDVEVCILHADIYVFAPQKRNQNH